MIITVGDLHLSYHQPKGDQVKEFLRWLFLFESPYNTLENYLVLLGDLVEALDDPSELLEVYIDLFLNQSKFKHIFIMKGNHDENMSSAFTSALRPLKNVTIIESIQEMSLEGLEFLFLPHYDHTKHKLPPMTEYYSSKEVQERFNKKYDYVFHHVEDEQNHFSKKYCDLSWIKTSNWLCGHIHMENVTKGGRILGAPIFNSITEKNKTPYIASIDPNTKKYTLIEVPKFLSYYEVDYPNDIEKPKTKYGLWKVKESLNKEETLKYYTKQAEEKGFTFYPLAIFSKKAKRELVEGENKTEIRKSNEELFKQYQQDNKVEQEVADICLDIFRKKEE